MKPLLALLLIIATVGTASGQSTPTAQTIQPFSAVLWSTTTRHSPAGTSSIWSQRTVYTRDSSGNVRREVYKPTKGLEHNTSAPLERTFTTAAPPQPELPLGAQASLPSFHSTKERLLQSIDLGSKQISGLLTTGRRETLQDSTTGQITHTLETWYSPLLGLTVHLENRATNGDGTLSDLSELQLGATSLPVARLAILSPSVAAAVLSSTKAIPASASVAKIPLPILYRSFFTHIAHMERDRQAHSPDFHVNIEELEDRLRTRLGLSSEDWKVLVNKSVQIEAYTRKKTEEARAFADRAREARRAHPEASANIRAAGRTTLHGMQADLNTHLQTEINQLNAALGSTAAERLQTYLQGPLASSVSVRELRSPRLRKQQRKAEAQ